MTALQRLAAALAALRGRAHPALPVRPALPTLPKLPTLPDLAVQRAHLQAAAETADAMRTAALDGIKQLDAARATLPPLPKQ